MHHNGNQWKPVSCLLQPLASHEDNVRPTLIILLLYVFQDANFTSLTRKSVTLGETEADMLSLRPLAAGHEGLKPLRLGCVCH